MNTRLIALTCALAAAACAETPPAKGPAVANASATDSPGFTSPSTDLSTPSANTSMTNAPMGGSATNGTTGSTGSTGSTTSSPTNKGATNTGATAPAAGTPAPATNNPGAADQTKAADNTKTNDRDRHGTLTPMDQGNSGAETKITAAIRKGIMGDKSLSFNAKNVKVVTVGSKVTLRGPVKTDQEKASIEAIAKQTAGVTEVDDQLEVKK